MNPIYLALDTPDPLLADHLATELQDLVGGIKIGLTLWYANGPNTVTRIVEGFDWFLDVKLHDIPMQVAGAMRALVHLKPTYISIHSDGDAMMRAAVDAAGDEAAKLSLPRPKVLGVTKLTHLEATPTEIIERAHRIMSCGLDGIISSPRELKVLRSELGTRPILLTPGIRVSEVIGDDQRRTATPKEAIEAGANIIVVGRPITQAEDRRAAAQAILDSLA